MEQPQAHWLGLEQELAAWTLAGEVATLWWRDDDATEVTPALEAMMRLSTEFDVPLALATVPRDAQAGLTMALSAGACVVQHGWSHANHAPPEEKSAEFGPHRPLTIRREELAAGRARLEQLFAGRFAPVFVPPWNRLDRALIACLPELGLTGLSTFSSRAQAEPHAALTQVNCHVDPIDWRAGGVFRGESWTLARLCEQLSARRERRVDSDEATGLLTHHLRHDAPMWRFLEQLFAFLSRPGLPVRWLSVSEAFAS